MIKPLRKTSRVTAFFLKTALLISPLLCASQAGAQSLVSFQTGFNQTNDASNSNYTTGSIVGQNSWKTTNASYGQGTVNHDAVPHQGDGYLKVHGVIGYGVSHESGISRGMPSGGKIKISFKIGTPEPNGSDRRIEIKSSVFGMLFRVGKYPSASSAFSYAADANGTAFTGYNGSTWRNNSNWAAYSDGRQTIVEMTISRTGIDYHLTETWAPPSPNPYGWAGQVSYHCDFATPLQDVRDFGDLQFIGASQGVWTDAYIDDLKIEYLMPSLAFQTGFNQTNDVSGSNYTTGSIVSQNGWSTTDASYGQGTINNDTVPHQNDGYLQVHGVIGAGVSHDSGINSTLPPGGKIKISFKIGSPEPNGSDRRIEVKSSAFGMLFRVGKYPGASSAYSYAANARGEAFTGYDNGAWRYNSNWAAYNDGRQTIVEMTISGTGIHYHLKETWTTEPNVFNWASEVSHHCSFPTPLGDIRNFGKLQFVGASEGVWTDAFIDDLKIEYLSDWIDVPPNSTLNEAVAAAVTAKKSGIIIPAGRTINATTMSIPDDFAIVGANASTSKVCFTTMSVYDGFNAGGTAPRKNIEFRNFTVDSGTVLPPSGTNENDKGVINFGNIDNLRVSGMKFYSSPRASVRAFGTNIAIENNYFENGKFVEIVLGGTNSFVTGNTLTNGVWYGMSLSGANCQVTWNNISEFGFAGVGIFIGSLSNSLISNNTISNVREFGFSGSSAGCHDNAIVDNNVSEIGIVGGNRVQEAGTGINFLAGSHDNLILRNQVTDCLGYGIIVAGLPGESAPNNAICENTVERSIDPGITVSGAPETLIRKNSSNNCDSTGFTIGEEDTGLTSNGCKVFHNRAIGNTLCEGMDVNACAGGYFFGNYLEGNSFEECSGPDCGAHDRAGFRLTSANTANNLVYCNVSVSSTVTINNQIHLRQDYGIVLNHGAQGNRVKYNKLYRNRLGGLLDVSSAGNTISCNQTSSSTSALNSAPPVADAGLGAIVQSGQQGVVLDGSHSYFMNGTGTMTYSWQQTYGPSVTLSNANASQASFNAPTVSSVQLVGFRLTGSNSNGSTFDEVYMVIKP